MSIPVGETFEVNERFYDSMGIDMPRIIKTPNYIKQKVGEERIELDQILACQHFLDSVEIDFTDEAQRHIDVVRELLKTLKTMDYGREEEYYQEIVEPIMALKAGGGMFLYTPLYMLSNMMQSFLERVYRLDNDVLDIIDGYETAIRLCLSKCPKDGEHPIVKKLLSELERACVRYVQHAAKARAGIR